MPLKRTPPKSPRNVKGNQSTMATIATVEAQGTTTTKTNLTQESSDATAKAKSKSKSVLLHREFGDSLDQGSEALASQRSKRKFEGDDHSDMRSFMADMRIYFSNFTKNQDEKLLNLQESISDIKTQNAEIFKSIEFISNKYDQLSERLRKLEEERGENYNYISAIEERLDFFEKKGRSTYVEIRNIPKIPNETKESLTSLIEKIGSKVGVPVDHRDIKDIYRINSKSIENKPIIMELNTVAIKNNFIVFSKKFNKLQGSEHLNTQHLQLAGPPKKIYISDFLTPKLRRLFYLAREFAKENDFNYCWSSNGNIFLRKRDGSSHIRINTEMDLKKLQNIR
ncbi:unnamed protein product [Diatraea saccharalis]|uniref:FP protein C-terminal domain-containing protein n=1 Tax=Diatraea saccharalis TaxID=40085 RepID=A0A9N9QUA9_9NEOP|nr:unnamed protein product [Diatraea saccharalis]